LSIDGGGSWVWGGLTGGAEERRVLERGAESALPTSAAKPPGAPKGEAAKPPGAPKGEAAKPPGAPNRSRWVLVRIRIRTIPLPFGVPGALAASPPRWRPRRFGGFPSPLASPALWRPPLPFGVPGALAASPHRPPPLDAQRTKGAPNRRPSHQGRSIQSTAALTSLAPSAVAAAGRCQKRPRRLAGARKPPAIMPPFS
jgi:hypothetical protein